MNKSETMQILAVIRMMYPAYYNKASKEELKLMISGWQAITADYTYEQVSAGVKAYIASDTKGFPPSVGQVIDKVHKIYADDDTSELEAWNLVRRAVSNSNYNAQAEFDKLPKLIQKIIGTPNTLRIWGGLDIDEVDTVIQSNFMRSYRSRKSEEKEKQKLNPTMLNNVIELRLEERRYDE